MAVVYSNLSYLMGATYIFHRVFDFHGYMNVDLSTGARWLGMERDCV